MTGPVSLAAITAYLDQYLRIGDIPDEANALNGLQVQNRSGQVGRIVAAVDASFATIEGAGRGPAMLLVHHGLFWDGNVPLIGRRYRRVTGLFDGDLALYSAHIPLDVHAEVGNNHELARRTGLAELQPFDLYRGIPIGVQGILEAEMPREAFVARVEHVLGTSARLIPGGPSLVRRVGIITGGAGDRIPAAVRAGLDIYVTGEGPHHTYFDATELGVNAVFAGHYATETLGVKALAEHLSIRFGIPWEFHDHPTGL
ncbi:MAG TPA: Nif3-like dinuclear metal center hexameric protein [Gemmatimonadales bacterium]|nr:Nif3-like dinuclear metal center hexameric protein [Gemmatimonadales bacterium]